MYQPNGFHEGDYLSDLKVKIFWIKCHALLMNKNELYNFRYLVSQCVGTTQFIVVCLFKLNKIIDEI